ncbi:hypothetical protein EVAR_51470_1 [Eumeta japonica]|uniref:Uncharacterized protein n=1 Tax=Eumeta variegata TaxID=151549 RepID=A0A4C1Z256_EUMVA|nr:hypothetical protein EVAR_51470_1 [Eumeta japonica]
MAPRSESSAGLRFKSIARLESGMRSSTEIRFQSATGLRVGPESESISMKTGFGIKTGNVIKIGNETNQQREQGRDQNRARESYRRLD